MSEFKITLKFKTLYFSAFETRVEEANKIANRLGLNEVTFVVTDETYVINRGINGKYREFWTEVEVSGEYPAYKGWSFVTQLDHETKTVRSFGETNHRHLIGDTSCHHCNSNRSRVRTYVIVNEQGENMQVGGACLKHYNPTKSLNSLASFFDKVESFFDDFESCGGRYDPVYSTLDVLTIAVASVEDRGFVSQKNHDDNCWSTRRLVSGYFNPNTEDDRINYKHLNSVADFEKVEQVARDIINWASDLDPKSDYEFNLKNSVTNPHTMHKTFGFVIAAVVGYRKAKELDEIKQQEREEVKTSEYVGVPKKRQVFENVTIKKIQILCSDFGDTYLHHFVDQSGNLLVWFGTKRIDADVDNTLNIKAIVKSHQLYNEVKQTLIQRVVIA